MTQEINFELCLEVEKVVLETVPIVIAAVAVIEHVWDEPSP